MATVAEQWVLVEMVQALYEVSLSARAAHDHTRPFRGGTGLVHLWPESWAGLAGSRPDPQLLWLEGLAGEARAEREPRVSFGAQERNRWEGAQERGWS